MDGPTRLVCIHLDLLFSTFFVNHDLVMSDFVLSFNSLSEPQMSFSLNEKRG